MMADLHQEICGSTYGIVPQSSYGSGVFEVKKDKVIGVCGTYVLMSTLRVCAVSRREC